MALINGVYVFVETEDVTRSIESTDHSVESGLDITDNIKRKPTSLSIKGAIVGNNAKSIVTKLESLQSSAQYIKYVGGEFSLSNSIIKEFKTTKSNKMWGGYEFSMEIQEIRVAKVAHTKKSKVAKGGTQQVDKSQTQTKRYYTVKKGDCLWNIAKAYYGSGAKYTKIVDANKNVIRKANLIYPGDKLLIPD